MTNNLTLPARLAGFGQRLRRNTSGIAMVEFALSLPILMALGVTGTDTAMFMQKNQMVSQVALTLADNTSRVGDESLLQQKIIFESDMVDILEGTVKLANDPLFTERARVFVSSVAYDPDDDVAFIEWQRCIGTKTYLDERSGRTKTFTSSYGAEGKGKDDNTLAEGIGPDSRKVLPVPNSTLIFVEVQYDYQSLFGLNPFIDRTISATAAMNVREIRQPGIASSSPGEVIMNDCA